MTISFARGVVRGALTLAFAISAIVFSAAAAQAAPKLSVSALSFAESSVDATRGAADELTFTIKDSNRDAEYVAGTVTMRMRSTITGAYLGHGYTANFSYGNTCCWGAVYVSGTIQESTYSWTFPVPSYSDDTTATWEVSKITISDDKGAEAAVGSEKLSGFGYWFTATTLVDSSGPTVDTIGLYQNQSPVRPYVYLGGDRKVTYRFTVQDWQSGFWKGTIQLAGPAGQSVTTSFAWEQDPNSTGTRCGMFGGDQVGTAMDCGITVTLPTTASAGSWRLASLVVVNNAGGRSSYKNPTAPAVTATWNTTLQASDFAISPNPVDNWRHEVQGEVTMKVTGARKGISQVYIDVDGACSQWGNASTKPDGTITVPMYYYQRAQSCTVTGIAIMDGAGAVALYGKGYQAPDPGLTARQLPDTTPPVVTGAVLDPKTLPASETGDRSIKLTIRAEISTAPITGADVFLFDSAGTEVAHMYTGAGQADDGTVTTYPYLPWQGLEPGKYTVGLHVSDAGQLSSWWDVPTMPSSKPIPEGPVTLTVTEG